MSTGNQSRRRFLRLTGGGIVTAAVAINTGGCAMNPFSMPAPAIAAWQGPEQSLPLRHWVLSHALLAPNPHNRQPWKVTLVGRDQIELRIDDARLLPHTDPFARQIMIGTGAFLGLLELAAAERGYRTEMTFFPDGPASAETTRFNDQVVARLRLVQDSAIKPDPLFAQVFRRHTERGDYDINRPLPDDLATRLRAATAGQDVSVNLVTGDAARVERLATLAKKAFAIELQTPHTFRESLELLRIGADEINAHRDGISITDPMLVMIDKLGLFDRENVPAPDSSITRQQIDEFDQHIDSTPGYFTLTTAQNERASQLKAGIAYVRAQLAATGQDLVMQPVSQALQEYPEMINAYRQIHTEVISDAYSGHTVQMFCRIGSLAPATSSDGPSPRRGLQAHLA